MSAPIVHIGINADDVEASRAFYEQVLGWPSHAWGPPGFFKFDGTGLDAAAVQQRRDLDGIRVTGFECTAAVEDLAAASAAAVAAGGRLLTEPAVIPGVGELIWVADPSGNPLGLMKREAPAG